LFKCHSILPPSLSLEKEKSVSLLERRSEKERHFIKESTVV